MSVAIGILSVAILYGFAKWFFKMDEDYIEAVKRRTRAREIWEKRNPFWYRKEGYMSREARDERQRAIDLIDRQLEKEVL